MCAFKCAQGTARYANTRAEMEVKMKAAVDEDTCIACGLCVGTCETVFAFNDNGKAFAQVDTIPPECETDAQTARDGCPVDAISIDS